MMRMALLQTVLYVLVIAFLVFVYPTRKRRK